MPENTLEFNTRIRGSAAGGGRTAPSRSCCPVILPPYNFSFASLLSMRTEPSNETPAKSPFVLLYENTPATPFKLAAPAASAFRPTGPAAILTFPPSVMEACCANDRTAAASLRMKTKSVSSKPICPPKPPPAVPIADGADHVPSLRRATTIPEPKRPDPRKPALKTVSTARPYRQSVCRYGDRAFAHILSHWLISEEE
jgi:hypothetical protein